jgi:hypothetical protein
MTNETDLSMAERYQAEAERIESDIRETEARLPHYDTESRKDVDWVLGEKRTAVKALLGVAEWHRERAKLKER